MVVNLLVLFLTLIIGKLFSNGKQAYVNSDKNRKKYIKIISFILILQSGLRNVAVGSDTYSYYLSFEASKKASWNQVYQVVFDYYKYGIGKDPGFPVFEKLCSLTIGEYQGYLLLIALIFFTALGNFIYKNTSRLSDAIVAFVIYSVLFYSFFSITGHRQTIATAVSLYSFEFLKKRKLLPFVLMLLVASTLHKSVLIFIPFYFICRIKKPKLVYYCTLFLFPVFMVLRNSLALYFQSIGGYKEYDQYEGSGTYTFTFMFLLIAIVAFIRSKSILKQNSEAQYYFNAFALALLFIPLTWINPTMMRVVQYFSIFMLLLIPEIIHSLGEISIKIRKDARVFVIVILIVLYAQSSANSEPYGFFWEEMRLSENYFISD